MAGSWEIMPLKAYLGGDFKFQLSRLVPHNLAIDSYPQGCENCMYQKNVDTHFKAPR